MVLLRWVYRYIFRQIIYLYRRGSTYVLFSAEHEISVGYNINAVISLRESMGTLAPSFILYPRMVAGVSHWN